MGNDMNSNGSYNCLEAADSPSSYTDKSFGLHGESIRISGKKHNTMTVNKTISENGINHCAYSHIEVDSESKSIHKYLVEINKMSGNIKIGITSDDYHTNECFENAKDSHYYSFWPNGKYIINNPNDTVDEKRRIVTKCVNHRFEEGDLIEIVLDLVDNKIYFGKYLIIESIPIAKDLKYKLVISASKKGDSVSIRKYEEIIPNN